MIDIKLPPVPSVLRVFTDQDTLDEWETLCAVVRNYAREAVRLNAQAEPVKRKRRYAQGTALDELGIIPMCDQVADEPVEVPSDDMQLDAVKSTAAIAWGWLWHVTTADDRVKTARDLLEQMLDKDLRRYGIQTAKAEGAQVNAQEIEAAMLRGEFGDPLAR